jgi:hypothetical protein
VEYSPYCRRYVNDLCANLLIPNPNISDLAVVIRYVEFGIAQETASIINNTEQYITNQLNHDGLRIDPKDVMKRLFQISKREYD